MKKSLLALAVLSLTAGVASAQSSVTIYGSIDLAVAKSNGGTAGNNGGQAGSTTAANSNNAVATNQLNSGKAWTVQQSNASRLGFRGNEDLGGGLSAQFQIEHRFNPDTGSVNNIGAFWQGSSYVQLTSASLGSVFLGRVYGAEFYPAVKSDPFGWDGVGQLGTDMYAGFKDPNPLRTPTGGAITNNVRTANAVGYKTPVLGGLRAQIGTGLGEGLVGRDDSFNVEYGAGPIYAAVGYARVHGAGSLSATDGSNARNGDSLINLALHYDFGVIKPMAYYARAKVAAVGATPERTNKFFSIGALAPIGPGNLKTAYYRYDPDGANANGSSNVTSKFAVGYDYYLSKRTSVYADLALTRSDVITAGAKLTNNSTYALGVKHTF